MQANELNSALVTGGAGLIGSHLVDLLINQGWRVRILDRLEPQTHAGGAPSWINPKAELMQGDIQDKSCLRAALEGVEVVFHLAAYGGYMPEIAKYLEVNVVGTGRLLEVIKDDNLPIRKVVVASSQAVYTEGAVNCHVHGLGFPPRRAEARLVAGDFAVPCPTCGGPATGASTPESAPTGGETVYAISKASQERLALAWGKQSGIPTVALRYACTYGPRQSIFNPYTGVISIFCTRLVNDLPPLVYEDGRQTRDLCNVEDVARANYLAATTNRWDGLAVNVGSGKPTAISDLALMLADLLGKHISPELPGEFRPGEMRALTPDLQLARSGGFEAEIGLAEGISRYLEWLRTLGPLEELFSAAARRLRQSGAVRSASI